MDFALTPEQHQLQNSVARFGREYGDFAAWRRMVAAGHAFDTGNWRHMAELGWLGIAIPERDGGLGGTPVDTMVVMEGIGCSLALEPFVSSCVLAPALLAGAPVAVRETLLPGIAAGEVFVTLAQAEPNGRFDLSHVETIAVPHGGGHVLTGIKSHVMDGATADWFVVPARTRGEMDDTDGITLFLVAADAAGLVRENMRGPDHRHNARLTLDGVAATALLGSLHDGLAVLERAVDAAIAARLAEAVGAMDALRDMTLDYLKTRQQFGVAIGSFQALQHRMVDISTACEEARSMTYQAVLSLSLPRLARRRAISAAKARVGQTGMFVGHQAVQLHGGIGTSDELAVSHYLKRLLMIDLSFGNADHHRALFTLAEDSLALEMAA